MESPPSPPCVPASSRSPLPSPAREPKKRKLSEVVNIDLIDQNEAEFPEVLLVWVQADRAVDYYACPAHLFTTGVEKAFSVPSRGLRLLIWEADEDEDEEVVPNKERCSDPVLSPLRGFIKNVGPDPYGMFLRVITLPCIGQT